MKNKNHKYRKSLYKKVRNFYPWDMAYNLDIFRESIIQTRNYIKLHGNEEPESRTKKINDMDRVIWILKQIIDDTFVELAETELNIKWRPTPITSYINNILENNDIDTENDIIFTKIYKKSIELHDTLNNELFDILRNNLLSWWD